MDLVLAVWVAAGLGQYQAKLQDATTNDPATFSPRERRVDPRPLDAPRTPHERPTPADPSADGSRVTNPASSARRTSSVTAVWRSDNRDADDSANYITP